MLKSMKLPAMPNSSMARVLLVLIVGGLGLLVWHWYGPIGSTRYIGLLWLSVAMWASFSPNLEIYGNAKLWLRLVGGRKLVVTIPIATISLGLLIYAPEITCSSASYAHLCN
jgi:hypothetical protein